MSATREQHDQARERRDEHMQARVSALRSELIRRAGALLQTRVPAWIAAATHHQVLDYKHALVAVAEVHAGRMTIEDARAAIESFTRLQRGPLR